MRIPYIAIIVLGSIISLQMTFHATIVDATEINTSTKLQHYNITGSVVPANATFNTCCSTPVPAFDNETGEFHIEGLENGTYTLAFGASGYENSINQVTINGSDIHIGTIYLQNENTSVQKINYINIGPWMDGDNSISGVNVSFTLDNITFWNTSDASGMVLLMTPSKHIPYDTILSARYLSRKISWEWNDDDINYTYFGQLGGVVQEEGEMEIGGGIGIGKGIGLMVISLVPGLLAIYVHRRKKMTGQ